MRIDGAGRRPGRGYAEEGLARADSGVMWLAATSQKGLGENLERHKGKCVLTCH